MRHFVQKFGLHLIAFIVGFVVMTLEMAGSRILSPYFGVSINTWTVLIGLILGSLSIGYWYGGIIADKGIQRKNLSVLLFSVGLYIIAVGFFHNVVINAVLSIPHITLLWGSFITGLLLFFIPNVLLGMVNPYLAKLMITTLTKSGSKMGNLSAISTIGNIIGTFTASFIMIPQFGITAILIGMGIVLIALSCFFNISKSWFLLIILSTFLAIGFFTYSDYQSYIQKRGLYSIDTEYGKVLIYKQNKSSYLITGAFGYESSSSTPSSKPYLPNFDAILSSLLENPKSALVLGGGTFNLSNYLLDKYQSVKVTSVEIDKKIAEIAYVHFGYQENLRHSIVIEDARTFINRSPLEKYDLVINDTFHDIVPPYHLLTKEAVQKVHDTLSINGIYVSNIASALSGKNSWLLGSTYKTISTVFPHVVMIPLEKNSNKNNIQSVLVVAVKDTLSLPVTHLEAIEKNKVSIQDDILFTTLTDDFAPVEFNLLSITTGRSMFHLSRQYLKTLVNSTYHYLISISKRFFSLAQKQYHSSMIWI